MPHRIPPTPPRRLSHADARMMSLCQRLAYNVTDFAQNTSAHGIPRAFSTKGFRRCLWLILFFGCLCAFSMQAYMIVVRFLRNDIIVSVELKFERISFPAVSVCNINPYKNSLARMMGPLGDTLSKFDNYLEVLEKGAQPSERRRRSVAKKWRLVESACVLDSSGAFQTTEGGAEVCLCRQSRLLDLSWDCRPKKEWKERFCPKCYEENGLCEPPGLGSEDPTTTSFPCVCSTEHCLMSEFKKMHLKWPLQLTHSLCDCDAVEGYCSASEGASKMCQCVGPKNAPAYCAPLEEWIEQNCAECNWWSECERSWALEAMQKCLCDRRHWKCFAVEEGVEEAPTRAIRVRREARRVYEKIQTHFDGLLAVYAKCDCSQQKGNIHKDCPAIQEPTKMEGADTCLCFFDQKNGILWPCYKPEQWMEHKCTSCSPMGNCVFSDEGGKLPCVCVAVIRMCVRIDDPKPVELLLEGNSPNVSIAVNETSIVEAEDKEMRLEDRIPKFWEIATTPPPPKITVKEVEEKEKALGMKGVNDSVALKAVAKENMVFAVQSLNDTDKESISYTKAEFITKCSFNGQSCSIENDFDTYHDPIYGNCFTFNSNKSGMTSERAGANYGLRFQVFVNISDYLPTTESAGVRLTVHSPDEQPFADTHGYNAPTGFVSSFGIRMKRMSRLPKPYGDCNDRGKDEDFIYKSKNYSTEACQRSCTQKYLVRKCGCGDPRFPMFRDHKNCPVDNATLRECLRTQNAFAGRNIDQIGCRCRQPCQQDAYSVSYSASRWPASPASIESCNKALSKVQCFNFFREQGAYIEVYFEQLNYESLLESEAYGLPNLLSDFGGQLGLWMGVSVITIMEIFTLLGELAYSVVRYPFQLCCARRKPVVSKGTLSSSAKYDIVRHASQFNHFSQFVP
ncbi:hypothetical protein QR680_009143 [Steinernema hermaphroditum]|uniref:Uncharacterized protein n=1 Tax=Steinernema hermaphroditum TaxID=289476 RepID=A0AA39IJ63_9BILA|nr:hypothetical protein QR680_009143 [Steinernema hermaphroditum]